ncbi:hypothetical protein GQ53DRAFT_846409 [Thozetella sp. PMI_491]|nr:hypothetical protein GQ53DRAFT_846409 [Thozetella sp. PMI_491]
MTGRGRGRGGRASSRRTADSTSPTRRVTRQQQNANIDPNLGGEPAVPPTQGRRTARQAVPAVGSGADGTFDAPNDFATPVAPRTMLSSIEEQSTPSQRLAQVKLMRKFLDRLFISADDIFNHLLSQRDDSWQDEYDGLKEAANTFKKHYVSDPHTRFISLEFVLSKIEVASNSALWLAACKTIWAVNLTQLLADLVEIGEGHLEDLLSDLQNWDLIFPASFVPDKELIAPDDTFDQAIHIRTQLFIATLHNLHSQELADIDALAELAAVFCANGTETTQLQKLLDDVDSSIEFKQIPGFDLAADSEYWFRLCGRLKTIYTDNKDLDLGRLQSSFPLEEFVKGLQLYVQNAYIRVKEALQLQGALSSVPSIFEVALQSPIASQLEADAAMARPRLPYHSSFPGGAPPSAQPISSYPPPENPYASQATGPSYAEAAAAAAVAAGQKRPAPDDGEEDAFEKDTRAPQNKRKATGKPRAKRTRKSQGAENQDVPSSGTVAPVAQMDVYDPNDPQMEPDLDALTQRSREIAAAHRTPREPQTRTPWSQHDTKLLIKAVDIFRCKWSKIANEIQSGNIPFQHPRNQQALRDKARILKQDYLRTDGILPPSFDLVVLGKKEVDNVKSVGRNPFRKEAEVIDGRPVNTLLQLDAVEQELMPQPEPLTHEPTGLELLQQAEQLEAQPDPIQQVLEPEAAQLEALQHEIIPAEVEAA